MLTLFELLGAVFLFIWCGNQNNPVPWQSQKILENNRAETLVTADCAVPEASTPQIMLCGNEHDS